MPFVLSGIGGLNVTGASIERRKFPRFDVELSLFYQFYYNTALGIFSGSGTSKTKNISIGGVRFSVDRYFPINVFFHIEMALTSDSLPITTNVCGIWTKKRGKGYEVGGRFTMLDKASRNEIKQLTGTGKGKTQKN